MAIGGVVINFTAKTAKAVSEIRDLTRSLTDVDDKADKAGGTFKKKLAVGAAAVGSAMLVAGGSLIEFAKAAAEDRAEAETLANTLKAIPGITDAMVSANADWIDSMQIASGVADTDLRVSVSKLALATGDLEEAQKLTTIAVDTAAGSGKSLKTVTDALAKAAAGNTTALKRQFPWLDKNKDGAVDLDEALTGLKGAYEGAAEAAADKKPWDRLNIVLGEIKEKLGDYLLPYLDDLSAWLKDKRNQKKLDEWISDFGTLVGILDDLATGIKDVATAFGKIFGPLTAAWNALPSWLKEWIKDGMPIIPNSNYNTGRSGNPVRSISALSAPSSRSAAAPVTYTPTVIVTEEQVYRAVARLVMRGDARNGRTGLAVP